MEQLLNVLSYLKFIIRKLKNRSSRNSILDYYETICKGPSKYDFNIQ